MIDQKIKIVDVKFRGIDRWNRPVFISEYGFHYGSTNRLYDDEEAEEAIKYFKENPSELEFFGMNFGCEPEGGYPRKFKLKVID